MGWLWPEKNLPWTNALAYSEFSSVTKRIRKCNYNDNSINWKKFGDEKVFETKLRFQIKIDDFR